MKTVETWDVAQGKMITVPESEWTVGLRTQYEWEQIHSKGELPSEIEEVMISGEDDRVLFRAVAIAFEISNKQVRRGIGESAVKVNQVVVLDEWYLVESGDIIQVGKRRFAKVVLK